MGSKPSGKSVKVLCINCQCMIDAWRDETGLTKSKCPKCGSVTVSRVMSRRHMQLDMYAPKGQQII